MNSNGLSYPLGYNHFNKSQYNGNKNFIINCMHYLLGNEDLININSKQYTIRLLDRNKVVNDKLKCEQDYEQDIQQIKQKSIFLL